jgi:hypothetical protein
LAIFFQKDENFNTKFTIEKKNSIYFQFFGSKKEKTIALKNIGIGCKQGKVDGSLFLVKKNTCNHENVLMY